MRISLIGLTGLTLSMIAAPAAAQGEGPRNTEALADYDTAPPSDFELSANVAVTSDYRFRGVSLSDGDFALQGGVNVIHSSGFYAGAWASTLDDTPTFGKVELDLYGGWGGKLSSAITLDVGLLYNVYPGGSEATGAPSDYFEPYASLSGTLGPVQATAGVAYAWDGQDALGNRDNVYLYLDIASGIPTTPVTLNAHAGYTNGALSFDTDDTSWDFSVGADYALSSVFTVGVKYTTVEGPRFDDLTNDGFLATLAASF